MWRKTPNSREEMPDYVERSYHEALINALVHRDLLVNGSEIHIDIFDDRMEIYSPGGMPDGTFIQDRDPLTVPSTRRNPLLADIFERLGYMERRGSGFGKIIRSYEAQVNYKEGKRPYFLYSRSTSCGRSSRSRMTAASSTASATSLSASSPGSSSARSVAGSASRASRSCDGKKTRNQRERLLRYLLLPPLRGPSGPSEVQMDMLDKEARRGC